MLRPLSKLAMVEAPLREVAARFGVSGDTTLATLRGWVAAEHEVAVSGKVT